MIKYIYIYIKLIKVCPPAIIRFCRLSFSGYCYVNIAFLFQVMIVFNHKCWAFYIVIIKKINAIVCIHNPGEDRSLDIGVVDVIFS